MERFRLFTVKPDLPIYILIVSLFTSGFVMQYGAIALMITYMILSGKIFRLPKNAFTRIFWALLCISIISWLYNYTLGNADQYSFLFWSISYLPPFIIMFYVALYRGSLKTFRSYYLFYKFFVFIQAVLIVKLGLTTGVFIVQDAGTGTVGDANFVTLHISVVILLELLTLVYLTKTKQNGKLVKSIEICLWAVVHVMPESTFNTGLLIIVLGLVFFKEIILERLNIFYMVILTGGLCIGLYLFSQTFVAQRILGLSDEYNSEYVQSTGYFSKVKIYEYLITGELLREHRILIGNGPATFTSRSSVIRMPEERINSVPFSVPYFKSDLFKEFISPINEKLFAFHKRVGFSLGNFASPQTSVVSVTTELGLSGMLLFVLLFVYILYKSKRILGEEFYVYQKFVFYFTVYFIGALFFLNYWEYPLVSYTYILMTVLLLFCDKRKVRL